MSNEQKRKLLVKEAQHCKDPDKLETIRKELQALGAWIEARYVELLAIKIVWELAESVMK